MQMPSFRGVTQRISAPVVGLSLLAALAGCEVVGPQALSRSQTLPAADALSFEYERFLFLPGSTASGSVATQLRRDTVAFPVEGALTRSRGNPIPAEIIMKVDRMSTGGGRVSMSGDLMIRDMRLGGVMTRFEDYSYNGLMPRISGGAEYGPALFRLIEADALAWLAGLECSTKSRLCGEPGTVAEPDETPADEQLPELTETAAAPADADVDLQTLAKQRRGRTGSINAGGLTPEAILAAGPKPEPVPAAAPAPAPSAEEVAAPVAAAPAEVAPAPSVPVALGSTVASLGLLDRGGNWLRTPLVSEETPGRVRNSATGDEIDVLLIPKDGAPGAGSQISLAALSELGASLTDLLTLIVYRLE